jgi:hypothetical protein
MEHRLPATPEIARTFSELFVNRRAYTIQSTRPHPESGRHYYYRPKGQNGAPAPGLTLDTVSPASERRVDDWHIRHQPADATV